MSNEDLFDLIDPISKFGCTETASLAYKPKPLQGCSMRQRSHFRPSLTERAVHHAVQRLVVTQLLLLAHRSSEMTRWRKISHDDCVYILTSSS